MAYNGSEGGKIDRNVARGLMMNYRNSNAFPANNNTEGMLFGRDHIEDLLAQTGCKGIRIYYGKDGTADAAPTQLILVGIDIDGNDMASHIVDMGMPCPTYCSTQITKI